MGAFNSLNDSFGSPVPLHEQQVSNFEQHVAAGDFIEVEPGKFISREAAIDPLAALADAYDKGRPNRASNISGVFATPRGSGEDATAINRFCNFFSHRRRDD